MAQFSVIAGNSVRKPPIFRGDEQATQPTADGAAFSFGEQTSIRSRDALDARHQTADDRPARDGVGIA